MNTPKIVFFLPCERPLVDALTGQMSLIGVLDNIQPHPFQASDEQPPQLQEARFVLMPFFIATAWLRTEVEEVHWEQLVTLTAPDGRETELAATSKFAFGTPGHRVIQQTNLIAGRLYGVYALTLKLRRVGSEEWQTIQTYPLHIQELALPAEENEPDEDTPEA